jgi:hypothetical protein
MLTCRISDYTILWNVFTSFVNLLQGFCIIQLTKKRQYHHFDIFIDKYTSDLKIRYLLIIQVTDCNILHSTVFQNKGLMNDL